MTTHKFAWALGVVALATASLVRAQAMDPTMPGMDHGKMASPDPKSDHEMTGDMIGMDMSMTGHTGSGSGTAVLPGAEGMMHGVHLISGGWRLMLHGYAWGTYSDQGGPRGDSQAFVTSMAMVEASRDVSDKTRLQVRGMFSLDPLIGARGYPNLFATGETAGGAPLVDRQHPHDLFMELSARVDTDVSERTTAFIYGGPVAEPALGPSAFMHRRSAKFNPEAPITHHWFDSTHISFGVVTAGLAGTHWQIEGSAFRGREPDERRWDIETPALDSWSIRGTWTPSPNWTISASHGFLKAPEVLHPEENEQRTIGTIAYADARLSMTAAYAIKNHAGRSDDAAFVEANWDITPRHALFGRAEMVQNAELFEAPDPLAGPSYRVGKATIGYAYTLPIGLLGLSIGGSANIYAKPTSLDITYGKQPKSFTLFAKLSLEGQAM